MQSNEAVGDASGHHDHKCGVCNNWVACPACICGSRVLLAQDLGVDVRQEWHPIEAVITNLEEDTSQDTLWNFGNQRLQNGHLKDGEQAGTDPAIWVMAPSFKMRTDRIVA